MTTVTKIKPPAALDAEFGQGNWLYIGRGGHYCGADFPKSDLANPVPLKGQARGATLPNYRQWLWDRIQAKDEKVLAALRQVATMETLVCHCHQPGPCHGHIVVAAAEWLQGQEAQ